MSLNKHSSQGLASRWTRLSHKPGWTPLLGQFRPQKAVM